MRSKTILKRAAAFVFSVLLVFAAVSPQQSFAEGTASEAAELDLSANGLRIGVGTGTIQEQMVRELFPEAQVYHFEKVDGCTAVAQGKIDCYLFDKKQLEITVKNGMSGVKVLDQTVGGSVDIALGLSDLCVIPDFPNRVNSFIDDIRADGMLDDMYDRWIVRGEDTMPDIPQPENPQWHLTVGTTGIVEPYSYFEGSELTGFDIELMRRFAVWLNADVSFAVYDYGSIIAAARTGKVDLIAANLQVTTERAEALRFSEPIFQEETGIVVRDTAGGAKNNALQAVHWQDYNGKRLGVMVGPLMEDAAAEHFPDSEILLFNGYPDCIAALLAGKIVAFLGDEPELKSLHAEQPEIDYIHDNITSNNYCFAFRKNDAKSTALCEELNAYLERS